MVPRMSQASLNANDVFRWKLLQPPNSRSKHGLEHLLRPPPFPPNSRDDLEWSWRTPATGKTVKIRHSSHQIDISDNSSGFPAAGEKVAARRAADGLSTSGRRELFITSLWAWGGRWSSTGGCVGPQEGEPAFGPRWTTEARTSEGDRAFLHPKQNHLYQAGFLLRPSLAPPRLGRGVSGLPVLSRPLLGDCWPD